MAQTGYTPISIYYSATTTNVPTAGNLVAGELAINTADGILFYKDSAGAVQTLASKSSASGSFTNLAYTGTLTGGTGVVNLGSGQFYKDASGNIGVGTASPATKLNLGGSSDQTLQINGSGTAAFLGTSTAVAQISSNRNPTTGAIYDAGRAVSYINLEASSGNGNIQFYTTATNNVNATERMRIDSSGNVGIGTSSPAGKLHIAKSTADDVQFRMTNTVSATAFTNSYNGSTYLYNEGAYNIIFGTSNTERMRIDSSGNFIVGSTAYASVGNGGFAVVPNSSATTVAIGHIAGTGSGSAYTTFYYNGSGIGSITQSGTTAVLYNLTSDARLKTNIVDAPLGNIDDVKVRSFDWKSDGSHVKYGFIAQELVEVAPYAVHQPQDPEEMMAVDYSKLVPMMIKEIQDLKQRIKTLESK